MSVARYVVRRLAVVVLAIFAYYDSSFACVCGDGYVTAGSPYSINSSGGPVPGATMTIACDNAKKLARTAQRNNAIAGCTNTGGKAWIIGDAGTFGSCTCGMFGGQYYCSITLTNSTAQCCVPDMPFAGDEEVEGN